MSLYRISPFLWNQNGCMQSLTVYGISCCATDLPSVCTTRPQEDPAYYWDSPTFQRLLMPNRVDSVTWSNLPAWLSFAQSKGYILVSDISKLTVAGDLWIRSS